MGSARIVRGAVVPVAALAALLCACGAAERAPTSPPGAVAASTTTSEPAAVAAETTPQVGCANRSGADFPNAYGDRRNLVAGPLVLVGGRVPTSASVARRFDGQKYPLLVRAGQTVTVRVAAAAAGRATLFYGPHEDGPAHLSDGHRAVTFVACGLGERSGSSVDGEPVTFWSGFVMVRSPTCVALEVSVLGERRTRHVSLEVGASCPRPIGRAPVRGCATRAEGEGPIGTTPLPGEVALGPIAFGDLERLASPEGLRHYRAPVGYLIKAGVRVKAGVRATLVIGPSARGWVSLSYATRRLRRVADGTPAVAFQACAADQPAFSYDGVVGEATGFAGGFILSRPGCVPLEVRVAGEPTARARIPFGVRRC